MLSVLALHQLTFQYKILDYLIESTSLISMATAAGNHALNAKILAAKVLVEAYSFSGCLFADLSMRSDRQTGSLKGWTLND